MTGYLVRQVFPESPIPLYLDWDSKTLPRRFREPMARWQARKLADTWNSYSGDWCRVRVEEAGRG